MQSMKSGIAHPTVDEHNTIKSPIRRIYKSHKTTKVAVKQNSKPTTGKIYRFFIHMHLLPIVLVPGVLWMVSGLHKFVSLVTGAAWGPKSDAWIPWLTKHFSSLPFMSHSMIILSFLTLTFLQVAAGLYYLIGIIRGEFMINRGKQWLSTGIILGIVNIAILSIGQNLANDNMDIFELTGYFCAHLVCLFYINFVTEDFFLRHRK